MLQTILPLSESPYVLTDHARQRNYTYEETTILESSAHLRDLGCRVIERLRPDEERLIDESLAKGSARNGQGAAASVTLRSALVLAVRQAQLAMATDSTEEFARALHELLSPLWGAPGVTGSFIREVCEELRSRSIEHIGGYPARRFDEYLKVVSRYLITIGEVGGAAAAIADDVERAVTSRHSALTARDKAASERLRSEVHDLLRAATGALLPGGHVLLFKEAQALLSNDRCGRYTGAETLDIIAELRDAVRRHVDIARCTEFLTNLRAVSEYSQLVRDVTEQRATLLADVAESLAEATGVPLESKVRDEAMARLREVIDAIVAGSLEGGTTTMLGQLEALGSRINREKTDPSQIALELDSLLTAVERRLSSLSLIQCHHLLHRARHYLVQVAQVSACGETLFGAVIDQLVKEYESFYARRMGAKAYVVRDQEQIVYNTTFGLLPGAEWTTVGRFQAFGEFLAEHGFNQQMMFRSFELLDAQIGEHFTPDALAYFKPMWNRVRVYLEVVCSLPSVLPRILKEATEEVMSRHGAALSRYPNAEQKTHRDLLALLHTCAVTLVPNGEKILRRGLSHFIESIDEARMAPDMLDSSFGALVRGVKAHLPAPQRDALLPALERARAMIVVTAHVMPKLSAACTAAAEEAVRSHPDVAQQHVAAKRRAAEDMDHLVRRALLAMAPGGAEWAAQGIWRFGNSVVESDYGRDFLPGVHGKLHGMLNEAIPAGERAPFDSVMRSMIEAVTLFSDLGACEGAIVEKATSEVMARHPELEKRFAHARQKAVEDFRDALRYAVMGGMEGGEWWIRRYARVQMHVYRKSAFDPVMIAEAYAALARAARAELKSAGAAALCRRLEELGGYLTVAAAVSPQEAGIVASTWEALTKRHNGAVSTNRQLRRWTHDGTRQVLRAALLGMLPECRLYQHEVGATLDASGRAMKCERSLLRDAFAELEQCAVAKIQAGPVDVFVARLRETSAPITAAL